MCVWLAACAVAPEREGVHGHKPSETGALLRFAHEHPAMGTLFRLHAFAHSQGEAERGFAAATARIDAIERVATDYDRGSEARLLTGRAVGDWAAVSPDLAACIRAADQRVRESLGAFDPTVGKLTRLWRRALRDGEWPAPGRWNDARERVGWTRLVQLRDEPSGGLSVRLAAEGMRLDFGGVAKGVAVDEALRALGSRGIGRALVDGGGDLCASGAPPGEAGWSVLVKPAHGRRELRLRLVDGAVATSGDAFQGGILVGNPMGGASSGARYGHVLDPRSGEPLASPRAGLALARTAAEADGRATAVMVLGRPGLELEPLRTCVFFGPEQTEPCVGEEFPHDGVVWVEAP